MTLLDAIPLVVWILGAFFLVRVYRNGRLRNLQGIRIVLGLWLYIPCVVFVFEVGLLVLHEPPWVYTASRTIFLRWVAALGTLWCVAWHLREE